MVEGAAHSDRGPLHRQRLARNRGSSRDLLQHPVGSGPRSWLAFGCLGTPTGTPQGLPALDRGGDILHRSAGVGASGLGTRRRLFAGVGFESRGDHLADDHPLARGSSLPNFSGHFGQAVGRGGPGSSAGLGAIPFGSRARFERHDAGRDDVPSSRHPVATSNPSAGHTFAPTHPRDWHSSSTTRPTLSATTLQLTGQLTRPLAIPCRTDIARLGTWRFGRRSRSI